MIYIGGTNLTQTNFSQFYNGSEIVVAGKIIDNNIETFIPQVVAISVRINPQSKFKYDSIKLLKTLWNTHN